MNTAELRWLAAERLREARALLGARCWSGAYYLAGYAVECGLKACIIKYLMTTDMDQIPLLTEQIEAGRKVVERLVENGIAVTAAGWVKESDGWQWHLYLVTPLVGEDGATAPAYRRILAVLRTGSPPPEIDPFLIKVVSASAPVGQAIIDAQRHGGRLWGGYGGTSLGGMSVDGVYISPPLVTAA